MWAPDHRRAANRNGLRYPSDLTDDEWTIVEPMIPPARYRWTQTLGQRDFLRAVDRMPVEGVAQRPAAQSTVHDHLELWNWDGTLERIHHELYVTVREQEDREASPTAAIIDSQAAKDAQKGGWLDPSGYDAGKKIKGRKRHILVDTLGLPLRASSFIRLMFRTVMEPSISCAGRDECVPSSNASLLMADTQARRWRSPSGARGHGVCKS